MPLSEEQTGQLESKDAPGPGSKDSNGGSRDSLGSPRALQGCPVLQVSQSGGAGDIWASQGDRSASKAFEAWTGGLYLTCLAKSSGHSPGELTKPPKALTTLPLTMRSVLHERGQCPSETAVWSPSSQCPVQVQVVPPSSVL